MRRLIFFFAVQLFLPLWSFSEQVKVTTWNLEWFPSGSPNSAAPEFEAKRIREAADTISKINSDVVLLQEIRDAETCDKLAAALKPRIYHVTICSRFKDDFGGGLGRQQVAILSKKPAYVAWSEKWKTFGVVDPPRGYSFAAIRYGTNDVGFYSVHLKSNLTRSNPERQNQLNILKRELAIEQVMRRAKELGALLTNDFEAIVIGGDFNTNPDQDLFLSEKTLRLLNDEKFLSGFENLPLTSRITHPGKGRYPDATFDYVFVKGMDTDAPQVISSGVSDHYPVTVVLKLPK